MKKFPVEIYVETVWEIHDPNTAQLIAQFFDGDKAAEYAAFINGTELVKETLE